MWKPFQRYRALDREARHLFGRAAVLLVFITASLRLRGFNRTKEALQKNLLRRSQTKPLPAQVAATVQKACRMVNAAAHYGLVRPSCLVESLALWYLLEEQYIPVQLRIGVRKLAEKFEAHAWVEYEGVALNQLDEAHQHYAAFDRAFANPPGEKP